MNIVSIAAAAIDRLRRRHRWYATERALRAMPPEVLKDIGWPGARDGIDAATSRRNG